MKKKIILAYSGGLDTSVLVKWLTNKGFEVICFIGDVGQKDDFKSLKEKALKTGATKVYIENLQEEFVTDFIFPALRGNAIYEGRYLLGTALARPLIAKKQIEIAKLENAEYVGHGATAKGNDQVRFELTYYALDPNIKIISPWKDPEFLLEFKGRTDLINYAKKWNIPTNVTKKKPYSEDENLMHISHEAGILEDPTIRPPENIFTLTKSPKEAPDEETIIEIQFQNGNPISVFNKSTGVLKDKPLELFKYLNELGYENGIGRIDIVENRYVGVKSRGVYETPGATILWAAHRDIEGITMDRDVMHLRDMLIPKFAELIYYGFWYSPEMDFIMSAFNKSQEGIDGKVTLALYKGNINIIGRESQLSLYSEELSSMEGEGGFDAIDSKGFININSIRLKAHNIALKKRNPYLMCRSCEEVYDKTMEATIQP